MTKGDRGMDRRALKEQRKQEAGLEIGPRLMVIRGIAQKVVDDSNDSEARQAADDMVQIVGAIGDRVPGSSVRELMGLYEQLQRHAMELHDRGRAIAAETAETAETDVLAWGVGAVALDSTRVAMELFRRATR